MQVGARTYNIFLQCGMFCELESEYERLLEAN